MNKEKLTSLINSFSCTSSLHSNISLGCHYINSPIGELLAIGDDKFLYLLTFLDAKNLESDLLKIKKKLNSNIRFSFPKSIQSIQFELKEYFSGNLYSFKTPLAPLGTDFQKNTWNALLNIPYASTCSYQEEAQYLKKPKAYRAVANANGRNPIVIVIPCHRVISSNGLLGGYSSGIQRKIWLLKHEKTFASCFNLNMTNN